MLSRRSKRALCGTVELALGSEITDEIEKLGIHLTQVTPRSCGWAQNGSSPLARIERYGVGSTATACCTSR